MAIAIEKKWNVSDQTSPRYNWNPWKWLPQMETFGRCTEKLRCKLSSGLVVSANSLFWIQKYNPWHNDGTTLLWLRQRVPSPKNNKNKLHTYNNFRKFIIYIICN